MREPAGRAWRRSMALLRWRRHDSDMAEEIALHEAMKRDAYLARGMSPAEAAHAARRAMGNVTTMQETSREVWRFGWLRDAIQDVAYGARTLRRDKSFALVAILGLAFGLGFSAAVFTGFNAFVLRGWEVPEPDGIVALWATTPGRGADGANPSGFSLAQIRTLSEEARTVEALGAHVDTRADPTGGVTAAPVSAGYFRVLGVPMQKGRAFADDEDRLGAPVRVVVLSHRYWTNTLLAKPDVIGTTVKVRGVPFTVIGVAGEGFDGTTLVQADAWIPLAAMPVLHPRDTSSLGVLATADECCLDVLARLAPGVSKEAVAEELSAIVARHARPGVDTVPRVVTTLPFTFTGVGGPGAMQEIGPVFSLIGGGVAVVLLLACANVANLLLARATARQREMGIRLALGASRGRIIRQLMTESLLLATLASIPALIIARWAPGWIVTTLTQQTHTLQFSTDRNVLLFTAATAIVCCVLFGLAPALHASRPLALQRGRLPLRSVFLSAQVTFCVVLLVASALFVRSAAMGRTMDLGFVTKDVSQLHIAVAATDDTPARSARLATELPEIAASTGVRGAVYTSNVPFSGDRLGYRRASGDRERLARTVRTSPEYFTTLGIAMIAGRAHASELTRNEIVVNRTLAEQLGGVTRAIGSTLARGDTLLTIVGVTDSIHDVHVRGSPPTVYRAYAWTNPPRVTVRGSNGEARRLAAAIMARDPSLMVSITPYSWHLRDAATSATFAAVVSGALGALALTLASIGMFGVLSYWVQQRQQDISVRMALGAAPWNVARLVLGATGRAVGWGLAVGLVLAVGAAQLLRSNLFGLSPVDPVSYAGAMGVLAVAAVIATVLPVRRAVRIEPMQALRGD